MDQMHADVKERDTLQITIINLSPQVLEHSLGNVGGINQYRREPYQKRWPPLPGELF